MKWISEHIFTTSLANKLHGVDAAGIGRSLPTGRQGIGSYLGRSPDVVNIKEQSAPARLRHSGGEVIVVGGTSRWKDRRTHDPMKDRTLSCLKFDKEVQT